MNDDEKDFNLIKGGKKILIQGLFDSRLKQTHFRTCIRWWRSPNLGLTNSKLIWIKNPWEASKTLIVYSKLIASCNYFACYIIHRVYYAITLGSLYNIWFIKLIYTVKFILYAVVSSFKTYAFFCSCKIYIMLNMFSKNIFSHQ